MAEKSVQGAHKEEKGEVGAMEALDKHTITYQQEYTHTHPKR